MTSYGDKLPAKLGNPGIPTITCAIGKTIIYNALCDLGGGVCVMSYDIYKKLGLRDYSPTSITLQMADKTTKKPLVMIEDVLLRIDKHGIPTDFIILNMSHDDKLSVILGRPFLSAGGANVYLQWGKIVFNIYDDQIHRYFPKKLEEEKYVPPDKSTQEVNVFDSGQLTRGSTLRKYT
jgi:hypothetical protein